MAHAWDLAVAATILDECLPRGSPRRSCLREHFSARFTQTRPEPPTTSSGGAGSAS